MLNNFIILFLNKFLVFDNFLDNFFYLLLLLILKIPLILRFIFLKINITILFKS